MQEFLNFPIYLTKNHSQITLNNKWKYKKKGKGIQWFLAIYFNAFWTEQKTLQQFGELSLNWSKLMKNKSGRRRRIMRARFLYGITSEI